MSVQVKGKTLSFSRRGMHFPSLYGKQCDYMDQKPLTFEPVILLLRIIAKKIIMAVWKSLQTIRALFILERKKGE